MKPVLPRNGERTTCRLMPVAGAGHVMAWREAPQALVLRGIWAGSMAAGLHQHGTRKATRSAALRRNRRLRDV